jgi:hypothetical protein
VSGRGPAAARGATLLTAPAPHPGLAAAHVSSVVLGVGVVAYGLSASLLAALLAGTAAGTVLMFATAPLPVGPLVQGVVRPCQDVHAA